MIRELFKILSFKQLKIKHWVILFGLFIVIHIPAILNDDGNSNVYVLLAKAFSQGKVELSTKDMTFVEGTSVLNTGDLTFYEGQYYLPYPPFPALLIIPFLSFGGGVVNSVFIAVLLSCLNLVLAYRILKKIRIEASYIPWLIWGFFFGTSYWFVLLSSHFVYEFAEVVAVTCLLLLTNEVLGKRRGVLLGVYLGLSFLSRQFTLFIGIFILGALIYYYFINPKEKADDHIRVFWRKVLSFAGVTSIFLLLYLFYNYIRFDNPFATGYKDILFVGVLKERVAEYGVFSPRYVLYNLYNYLIRGFNIKFHGKDLLQIRGMNPYGTSLFMASPFLVAAFKSGWPRFLRVFAWISIGVIFTGLLFYHNNGKDQVNASRFTLDFLPLMFVLTGLGAKNIPSWLFKSMVIYAILLNILAFFIHLRYHTLK